MSVMLKEHRMAEILRKIMSQIQSTSYVLFINGTPKKYSNSYVYVKASADRRGVEFFTKVRSDGRSYEVLNPGLYEAVADDILAGDLFGFEFDKWVMNEAKDGQNLISVSINSSLKFLFIETSMYSLFKKNIPNKESLANITFSPVQNNGRELGQPQLAQIMNSMRLAGFNSMLELDRAGIVSRVSTYLPDIYKSPVFLTSMVQVEGIYNPLYDDVAYLRGLQRSKIASKLFDRAIYIDKLRLRATNLSYRHIAEGFNLGELVPFNFRTFVKLLAGLSTIPGSLSPDYPNKQNVVYSQIDDINSGLYPKIITPEERRNLTPDVMARYSVTNSLRTFVLENSESFQQKGYRNMTKLIEVLEEAALI